MKKFDLKHPRNYNRMITDKEHEVATEINKIIKIKMLALEFGRFSPALWIPPARLISYVVEYPFYQYIMEFIQVHSICQTISIPAYWNEYINKKCVN